jgi:hypothetical protein
MCYYFATILLFGPFIRLRFLTSTILPLEVCVQAADAITSLLGSYRQLYSLRRTPCFAPIIGLASNTVHLVQAALLGNPSLLVRNYTTNLQEMTFSHGFANRGLRVINIVQRICCQGNLIATKEKDVDHTTDFNKGMMTSIDFFGSEMEIVSPTFNVLTGNSIFSPYPTQRLPSSESNTALAELGFKFIDGLS